jgi:hypothetical protein
MNEPRGPARIFISYSHRDYKWLERLQVHLKPLDHEGKTTHFDDTMITPGTNWRDEIRQALNAARIAILLVSADYLASKFIVTDELPTLLSAAEGEGVRILPIIVSPCRFAQTESLARFQALNPPSRPLIRMPRWEQEALFVKATDAIEAALERQATTKA